MGATMGAFVGQDIAESVMGFKGTFCEDVLTILLNDDRLQVWPQLSRCLLIPFMSLAFLIKFWDKAWKPFAVWIAGFISLFLGKLIREGAIF